VAPATDADHDLEVAALAVRIAMLANEQNDELAGRRRTRARLRAWGEKLPAELTPARDAPILVHRYAARWLREAEAFAVAIDPGLATGGINVASFTELGIASPVGSGFVYPVGLFEIVRDRLRPGAVPGHVVAVNLEAHAEAVSEAAADADEATLAEAVALSLCGTVAHEAAHVAVNDAAGRRLPSGLSYDDFRAAAAQPAVDQAAKHGPPWVRAFGHATHRADRVRPSTFWWRLFRDDVGWRGAYGPGEIVETLTDELDELVELPLADILRRPAPRLFTDLFDDPAAPAA
jgi:hypothetical protein